MKAIKARSHWIPVILGAMLAVLVVGNATLQYVSFTEMQDRVRARFSSNSRRVPSATPVETNLVVNSAAALALLGAVGVLAARSRYLLRAQRWEQQLEQGRAVQSALIPAAGIEIPNVAVAAEFVPASEVGGDLYDVFPATDGRVAFSVGDVAGKGLPAALLMGLIHGAVRSNAWYRDAASQEAFAQNLNELLRTSTAAARFASLFWGSYDPEGGSLTYINAGHCPGFVVRPEGVESLDSSGPVLGVLKQSRFRQVSVDFQAGDLLVLYSDGVVEATNAADEEFGEDRLQAVLRDCAGRSAEATRRAILEAYRRFLGEASPEDDMTLLVLEAVPVHVAMMAAA
jgi:sigma-B regulation protein RsbU (phosphoserine phosphatase)